MDFRQTNNAQPQAAQQPAQQPVQPRASVGSSNGGNSGNGGKSKLALWGAGVLVLVALVAGGLWWALGSKSDDDGSAAIKKDAYQAVFLTNGQVYFGKLKSTTGKYATMENIYYLQVEQAVQPSTEKPADNADQNNNVQLIKLGNELHGPEDSMQISSDQILFWENLKSDSKISKAISDYKQ